MSTTTKLSAPSASAARAAPSRLRAVSTPAAIPLQALPQARAREPAVKVLSLPRRSAPLAMPSRPAEAAQRFVAWMQDHGFTGQRRWSGPDGLWEFYGWHCDEERRHPVPDNLLGEALRALLEWRQIGDHSTGKRRRIMHYMIPEPEPEAAPDGAPAAEPVPVAAEPIARPRRQRAA